MKKKKNDENLLSFSHRAKDGVSKVQLLFFVDFFRQSFGRTKVILTVVEREYTPDIKRQVCFSYQLNSFLYDKRNGIS